MVKIDSPERQYWLMKSEPESYSILDLKRDKRTAWTGIRNYQVRNLLRDEVKKGDTVLFYHSNTAPIGVVGEMEVLKTAYPDPTQFDKTSEYFDPKSKPENPTWLCVDVRFKKLYPTVVTLEMMKGESKLTGLRILEKGSRLSVVSVSTKHFELIELMSAKLK